MLTIGKVAGRTGLSASAIRYYGRHGLVRPARLPNGYRVYSDEALGELRFIAQAQSLGMTLREIGELLRVARNGYRPCSAVRALTRRHLAEVELQIRRLRNLRRELLALLARRRAPSGR